MNPAEFQGTAGNDNIVGWDGVDIIHGGDGNDTLNGYEANDLLAGNGGNDVLNGHGGVDVLQGVAGDDQLNDTSGNGLVDGGAGVDAISAGSGNSFIAGGTGNDTINTGSGADVIAFNRGDGADVVAQSSGVDNTLSLGGGIAYADISLRRNGNDLIVDVGAGDQVTLQSWYSSSTNRSVLNLQVVAEAMAGFSAGGGDPLADQRVEGFNFTNLVGRFDQERAANPALTSWAVMNALIEFSVGGSDSAALGGDLAYQYGLNGNLAGVGLNAAQTVLTESTFGSSAQNLNTPAAVYSGVNRLA